MAKDVQAELIALQNAWMAAWCTRDRTTLERILADEFTLTSARTDQLVPRQAWLDMAMTRARGESFEYGDFQILVHGDAAVVKSRMRQVAWVDDQPWNGEFMLTDVWFRRGGRWQVVARHSSTPPTREF